MSKGQQQQSKQGESFNPSIIKLAGWVDKEVRVRFIGGRTITGTLKTSDNTNNLIVDDAKEYVRDIKDPYKITDKTRELGLVFVKGAMVLTIGLASGMEEIENPFAQAQEE